MIYGIFCKHKYMQAEAINNVKGILIIVKTSLQFFHKCLYVNQSFFYQRSLQKPLSEIYTIIS